MSNQSICIRLATTNDVLDVQTCARAAYSKYIERMGQEPAPMNADFSTQIELGQVHVALCKSSFAGYVVFYPDGDSIHLENIAIASSFSRQGIGTTLINFVEQKARDSGKQSVELYTNEAMTENLAMYTRLGYTETERKRQMGFNRVFYRKSVL